MAKLRDVRGVLNGYWTVHSAVSDDLRIIEAYLALTPEQRRDARARFSEWFTHHVEMEKIHHSGENEHFFPKMQKYLKDSGDFAHDMTKRSAEAAKIAAHVTKDLQVDARDAEAVKGLREYVLAVRGRLATEEAIYVPLVLQYFDRKSYEVIEKEYQKKVPFSILRTFLPWSLTRLTLEERGRATEFFPPPVWFMYRWFLEPPYKRKHPPLPFTHERAKATKGLEI